MSSRALEAPALTATDDRSPGGQLAVDAHTPADAEELAEEAALQQALGQEQSNGG